MVEPRIVRGIGPEDCKIALIGEAPGSEESKYLKPFVGYAGRELDTCLQNAGIPRSSVYLTNVVKERPPNNNIKVFIDLSKKYPVLTGRYKIYEDALYEELSKLQDCNVFVALGNVPMYALLRFKGTTSWRGSIVHTYHDKDHPLYAKKVIPCIHPSAALRMYMYRHFIISDLRRALVESQYPEIRRMERDIILDPSFEECLLYLRSIQGSEPVAFDIETVQDEVNCISFALSPASAICIPFTRFGKNRWTTEEEVVMWEEISRILEDDSIEKWGQNLLFDSTFLHIRYGIITKNMQDTMIAMGIAYADYPKGLDFITSMFCNGEPYYKGEGKRHFKTPGSDQAFWKYNAMDSLVVKESMPKLIHDVTVLRNKPTYDRQRALIGPLSYMQERGVRIDTDGLAKESKRVGERLEVLEDRIKEMTNGMITNPRSVDQLKKYFYIAKNITPYIHRQTGKPTVDEIALKRLTGRGFKEAIVLLEIRKLTKIKGTYLDVKLDNDGRLRCAYKVVGTKTGRLSSSANIFGTGTNMQNLPKSFRKYLLADEGYTMYNIDLSQAENRIVAYIAPEPRMINAFETGKDVHCLTASLVPGFGTPEEIAEEDRLDIKVPLGNGEQTKRYYGKKSNHSLNYGLGPNSFALLLEISLKHAKLIRDSYFSGYQGIIQYHKWIRERLGKDLKLTNCMGRNKLFLDRWGDSLHKEGYAFIPQSTVADIINGRGLNFVYYNQYMFGPVELLMQVHDSIVFQISNEYPLEVHARCIWNLKESLEIPIMWRANEFVIPADVDMGENLKDRTKIKGFSDEKGLLKRLKFMKETE